MKKTVENYDNQYITSTKQGEKNKCNMKLKARGYKYLGNLSIYIRRYLKKHT